MKSRHFIAPAILTFAAGVAFAQEEPKKFDQADSNKDGILSVQEARTALPSLTIEAGGEADAMLTREAVKKALPQVSFGEGNDRGPITEEEYDQIAQHLQQSSSRTSSSSASSSRPSSDPSQASSSSSSSSQPSQQSSQQRSGSSTQGAQSSSTQQGSQSSQAGSQQQRSSQSSQQMEAVKIREFSEADRDKDGELSMQEARAAVPGLQLRASTSSGAQSSTSSDMTVTQAQVKQALPEISFESGSERDPITEDEFDKIVEQLEQQGQSSSSQQSRQPRQQTPQQRSTQ